MKYISIRDLRSNMAQLRRDLKTERDIIVTANGRPFAVLTYVEPDSVGEEIIALRRARARAALTRIRANAAVEGLDRMTMKQIDAIIAKARRERQGVR